MRTRGMFAGLLLLSGCSSAADTAATKAATELLHTRYNSGNCGEIRDKASDAFKRAGTAEEWAAMCAQLTAKLGKWKSASQTGWSENYNNGVHTSRGTFDAVFEKGKAREDILIIFAGNKALLDEYRVNSDVFNEPPTATPTPAK